MDLGRADLAAIATKSWGMTAAVGYSVKVTPIPFVFEGDKVPHFRCPPGTPRGGKWTDSLGSDCMLSGARVALRRIGERIGKLSIGEAPTRNADLPSLSERARARGYSLAQRVDNDPTNLPRGVRRLKDNRLRAEANIAALEDAIANDPSLEQQHRPAIQQLQNQVAMLERQIAAAEQGRSGKKRIRRLVNTRKLRDTATRIDNDPTNVYRKRSLEERSGAFFGRRVDEKWQRMFERARTPEERQLLREKYEKQLAERRELQRKLQRKRQERLRKRGITPPAQPTSESVFGTTPTTFGSNPPSPGSGPARPRPTGPKPKPGPSTPGSGSPTPTPRPSTPTPSSSTPEPSVPDPSTPDVPTPEAPEAPTPSLPDSPSISTPEPPTPKNPWITRKLDGGRGSTMAKRQRVRREVAKLVDTQLEMEKRLDALRKRTRGDFESDADYAKHQQQIDSVNRQIDQVREAIDYGEARIDEFGKELKPLKPRNTPPERRPAPTNEWFQAGETVDRNAPQPTDRMLEPTEQGPVSPTVRKPLDAEIVDEPSVKPSSATRRPTATAAEASADVAARRSQRNAQDRLPERIGGVFSNEQNARRRAAKVSREREGTFHLVRDRNDRFQIVPADAQVDPERFEVVERYRRGKGIGADHTVQPEMFSDVGGRSGGARAARNEVEQAMDSTPAGRLLDAWREEGGLPDEPVTISEEHRRIVERFDALHDAIPSSTEELENAGTEQLRRWNDQLMNIRADYADMQYDLPANDYENLRLRMIDLTERLLEARRFHEYREAALDVYRDPARTRSRSKLEAEREIRKVIVDQYTAAIGRLNAADERRFVDERAKLAALDEIIADLPDTPDAPDVTESATKIPGISGASDVVLDGRPIQTGLVPKGEIAPNDDYFNEDVATKALREGVAIAEVPDDTIFEAMLDHDLVESSPAPGEDPVTYSWSDLVPGNAADGALSDLPPLYTVENARFRLLLKKNGGDMAGPNGIWAVWEVEDKTDGRFYYLKASSYGMHDALLEHVGADMARLVGFDVDAKNGPIRLGSMYEPGPAPPRGMPGGEIELRWSMQPHVADYQSDAALQDRSGWKELRQHARMGDLDPTDLARIAVLDFLTGNSDRHEGNVMVHSATGAVRPIDHGLLWGGREIMPSAIGAATDTPEKIMGRAIDDAMRGSNSGLGFSYTPGDRGRLTEYENEVRRQLATLEKVNWADFYSAELRERRGASLSAGEKAHLAALQAFTEIRLRRLRTIADAWVTPSS